MMSREQSLWFLNADAHLKISQPYIWYGYSVAVFCILSALVSGGYYAPSDAVQGEVFRIMYVHVPLAVLSLAIYVAMGLCCLGVWVWHIKIMDLAARSLGCIGLLATCLVLVTGSIWAKPTWGVWWFWDARLTSECVLCLLYLGYLCVRFTIWPERMAKSYAALVGVIGLIDVPIVHYSVNWWYTLHQGASVLTVATPKIVWPMLWPLLESMFGFALLFACMFWHTMWVLRRYDLSISAVPN